jgi:hypothetical protein
MKLSQDQAFATTVMFTSAPDIHLLFMVGLVFFAGIAGMGTLGLLLLLAPLAMLFLARPKPRRVATVSAGQAVRPDGGASPPSSRGGSDQAAQVY